MTVPPSVSASCNASADLPLAVGPAISTALVASGIAMHHVVTLIGPDALPASRRTQAVFPRAKNPISLGPDAADIFFTPDAGVDQRVVAERFRAALGGKFDVVVQPIAHRRKK